MDNDVTSTPAKTSRQGRQRRRILMGAGAAFLVLVGVVVGGTWRNSTSGTSGALGATSCPARDSYNRPVPPAAPESNWHGCNLDGIDLAGANLFESDLGGVSMTSANLRGANLSFSSMDGAQLQNSDFTGANLSHASLTNANFKGARTVPMLYANLMWANLSGATLTNIDFTYATLFHATKSSTTVYGAYNRFLNTICWNGADSNVLVNGSPINAGCPN